MQQDGALTLLREEIIQLKKDYEELELYTEEEYTLLKNAAVARVVALSKQPIPETEIVRDPSINSTYS